MEAIKQLLELDVVSVFIGIFIILSAIISILTIISKFMEYIGKPIKWFREKDKDHDLLIKTAKTLSDLEGKQSEDTRQSILHDRKIKDDLSNFMEDIRKSVNVITDEQKEIVQTMNQIVESNKARDNAMMEEMCDRIGQKTRHYINDLHGIPEDEYDDFVRLFSAYKGIGGNHGAEAKYNYCINQLSILPVTKSIKE